MFYLQYGLLCVIYKNKDRIYILILKYIYIMQFSEKIKDKMNVKYNINCYIYVYRFYKYLNIWINKCNIIRSNYFLRLE